MSDVKFANRVDQNSMNQSAYNPNTTLIREVKATGASLSGVVRNLKADNGSEALKDLDDARRSTGRAIEDGAKEIGSNLNLARKDIQDNFVPAIRETAKGFKSLPGDLKAAGARFAEEKKQPGYVPYPSEFSIGGN